MQFKPDGFEWYLVPIVLLAIGYGIFISGPIGYSVSWVFLKAVRREKIEIKDMFAVFERNYWNAVIAGLVTTVIIVIGIFMLIVPGIIFACRLAFVPFLVIDQEMEALEALKASWAMTKGHGWTVFFMGLLAFLLVIAGLISIDIRCPYFSHVDICCICHTLSFGLSETGYTCDQRELREEC